MRRLNKVLASVTLVGVIALGGVVLTRQVLAVAGEANAQRLNRAIQPLRIGLASNRQDLARQYDAPEGDHANQRHARKHFVQSAHTALLTVSLRGLRLAVSGGR